MYQLFDQNNLSPGLTYILLGDYILNDKRGCFLMIPLRKMNGVRYSVTEESIASVISNNFHQSIVFLTCIYKGPCLVFDRIHGEE